MATRTKADPRRIAAKAVQKWYDSLLDSPESHTQGSVFQVTLDAAFDDVERALKSEYEREHGPVIPDHDDLQDEMFAREAGYLIGVQVGLRLRQSTGPGPS